MTRPLSLASRLLPLLVLVVSACGGEEAAPAATPPPLTDAADSLAWRIVEAHGGPAFDAMPFLSFTFASETQEGDTRSRRAIAQHLWDRQQGRYRVEWSLAPDSAAVALFHVDQPMEGQAYVNGQPADSTLQNELLQTAHRRYINDTYWLLAPLKLFDEGVTRTLAPDTLFGGPAVQLTFDDVGLTPGDTYFLTPDPETGRLAEWAFVLQNNPEAAPSHWAWTDYETLDGPAGEVHLATRKQQVAGDRALLTDRLAAPADVPDDLFTDPRPRLSEEQRDLWAGE